MIDPIIKALEKELLAKQRRGGDLEEESRLVNNIGKQLEIIGDFRRALHFHHYDRQISSSLNDIEGILFAIENMSLILSKEMNLYTSSKALLNEGVREANRSNDMTLVFKAHTSLIRYYLDLLPTNPPIPIRNSLLKDAKKHLESGKEALMNWNQMMESGLLLPTPKRRKKLSNLFILSMISEAEILLNSFQFEDSLLLLEEILLKISSSIATTNDSTNKDNIYSCLELKAKCIIGHGGQALLYKRVIEECYDKQLTIIEESIDDSSPIDDRKSSLYILYAKAYQRIDDLSMALRSIFIAKEYSSNIEECETLELDILKQQNLLKKAPPSSKMDLISYLSSLHRFSDALNLLRDGRGGGGAGGGLKTERDIILFLKLSLQSKSIVSVLEYYGGLLEMFKINSNDDLEIKASLIFFEISSTIGEGGGGGGIKANSEMIERIYNLYKKFPHRIDLLAIFVEWSSVYGLDGGGGGAVDGSRIRECRNILFKLWRAAMEDPPQEYMGILEELGEMDYFSNRKASKTVMSLVDGQFNMKSRSKAKNGVIFSYGRNRRCHADDGGGGVFCYDETTNKRRIYSSSSDDDEMNGFVVKDEGKPLKKKILFDDENSRKKPIILIEEDLDKNSFNDTNSIYDIDDHHHHHHDDNDYDYKTTTTASTNDPANTICHSMMSATLKSNNSNDNNILRINVMVDTLSLLVPINASLSIEDLIKEIEERLIGNNSFKTRKKIKELKLFLEGRQHPSLHPKDPIRLVLGVDYHNGGDGILIHSPSVMVIFDEGLEILEGWKKMMILIMNDGHYSYLPPPLRDDLSILLGDGGSGGSGSGNVLDFSFYETDGKDFVDHQFISLILASLLKGSSIKRLILSSCPSLNDVNLECISSFIGEIEVNNCCEIDLRYSFVMDHQYLLHVFKDFVIVS